MLKSLECFVPRSCSKWRAISFSVFLREALGSPEDLDVLFYIFRVYVSLKRNLLSLMDPISMLSYKADQ
jgi:hypothetical protein